MQVGRTGLHVGVDGRRPCLPVPTVYSLVLFVAFLRRKEVSELLFEVVAQVLRYNPELTCRA